MNEIETTGLWSGQDSDSETQNDNHLSQKEVSRNLTNLDQRLERIENSIGKLEGMIDKDNKTREDFSTLYADLKSYHPDSKKSHIGKLALGIIEYLREHKRFMENYTEIEADALTSAQVSKLLQYTQAHLIEDLEDLLEENGIEKFHAETKNGSIQKLFPKETSNQEKDKLIATRLCPGYRWEESGQVLSKEWVEVYRFIKPISEQPQKEEQSWD